MTINQTVPLLDLKRQYASIREEVKEVVMNVFDSQVFIMGPEVEALEKEVANYCRSEFAIGVSSGTDALLMALMASGVTAGDEVITSPYTFFATVGSIARLGAKPVFVDIDPETFNLDLTGIANKISSVTKAIIPVHLFGQVVDVSALMQLARDKNIAVIEDAAQAIGAETSGKRAGSIGHYGCFSFFPSKNLGGAGDGGLVTTNDSALAELLRALRNHGQVKKYYHEYVGGNFRLDSLQAAVLRVKLKYLDIWTARRQENAARYNTMFESFGLLDRVGIPQTRTGNKHIYNQYVIRVSNRDALICHLRSKGVGCEIYYPLPLHLQTCFSYLGGKEGDLPHAESAARETLALPIFPELELDEQEYVVRCIAEFFR